MLAYILVLTMYGQSVTIYPETFETKESCKASGELWKITAMNDFASSGMNMSFVCVTANKSNIFK